MAGILAQINSPSDLEGLNIPELKALCRELRETIINTVAVNGDIWP